MSYIGSLRKYVGNQPLISESKKLQFFSLDNLPTLESRTKKIIEIINSNREE